METPWGYAPPDWEHPKWNEHEKVHGWRNYASGRLRDMWESFTDEQKVAISAMLEDIAGNENWD